MTQSATVPPQAATALHPGSKTALVLAGLIAGYAAAVLLGYAFYLSDYGVGAPFWPASGVYLAMLAIYPIRLWPIVLLGVAGVHAVTDCGIHATPLSKAVGYWVSNTTESVLGALILRRLLARVPDPTRIRDVFVLCALAGLLPPTSILGASVFALDSPGVSLATAWQIWWLSDLLGILTVGSLIFAWWRAPEPGLWRGGRLEFLLMAGSGVTLAALVFFVDLEAVPPVLEPPILFPPLVWASLRFGPRAASIGSLLLVLLFLDSTLHGEGTRGYVQMREAGIPLLSIVIWVQSALVIASALSLTLVATMAERDRAEAINRRHLEESAHADKMVALGTLVSSVAHELDNPNQLIMMNLPVLRAMWDDASEVVDERFAHDPDLRIANSAWPRAREDAGRLLTDTAGAAERVRGFVKQLRSYGRVGQPQDILFDLDATIRDALTILGSRVKKATRRFQLQLDGHLPRVKGDPRRIEQVVVNLVLNACEALTDRQQGVFVRTFARDGDVVLEVRDEGAGMEAEALEHVTDAFFTTKIDGTGLGLAVVAKIVEDHHGQIRFTSEAGRGTVAEVSLPAADTADS